MPETAFIIHLGREVASLASIPGSQSLTGLMVKRLIAPSLSELLPVTMKNRFRVLQKLFLMSLACHAGFLPETLPTTKH